MQSPRAPLFIQNEALHRRKIAEAVNTLSGQFSSGSITLNASATTTTLTNAAIGTNTIIYLMPITADAATAQKNGMWFANAGGSATINHASNSAVDQTFNYLLIG